VFGPAGARRVPASLLLLTLVLLGVAAWCVWSRAKAPTDGTTVSPANSAVSIGRIIVSDREPGTPFRLGDEIVAIGGVDLNERAAQLPGGEPVHIGETIQYDVIRDGRRQTLEVALRHYPVLDSLAAWWPMLLVVALLLATSVTVLWARPRDPAARAALMTSSIGIVATVGAGFFPLAALDLVAGNQFWRWYAGQLAFALLWGAVLHFALAFPAVTRSRAKHRAVVAGAYLGTLGLYGIAWAVAFVAFDQPLERMYAVVTPVLVNLFVYPALIVFLLIRKYLRQNDERTRRPLLWLIASLIASTGAYFAVWVVPVIVAGRPVVPYEYQALPFAAVPIAMAAAVLRYRALNIEVAVSRSLVYGTLSAGAIGLYVALVSALSLVFPPIDEIWQQAAVAATIAVLVQPFRLKLQTLINKRLYGERDDPYRVVSALASRLENTPTASTMLPEIVETVAAALRLPYIAIEIQARGRSETAASVGTLVGDSHRMPLTFHGERVGNLVIGKRSQRELTRPDRIALAEVARHAGAAVYTTRLTRDLRRSRDRLVRAREMERRRILHELHDGVGPTLAAVALGLDVSRRTVGETTPTGELLGRLRDELQAAIIEIRRMAHGLRPPVLDRIGLIPAIREYAGALASRTAGAEVDGVTIVLEVPSSMPKLPPPVDVAAYRIICEALTNVTRHAEANSCAVRLWVDDDLHIEVVDDGIGLPAVTNGGVGLSSMRERATELGGECLVEADHDGGTRVFATLPLPKEGS
jgi:signal transduction histidine kinase